MVEARFYLEEGRRRNLVASSTDETKGGRVVDVKDNGNLVVRFDDGTRQEINRSMVTSSSLPTYRCPVGACQGGENFSCAEGHHGPVCGLCNETRNENGTFYSWSGSSCAKCQTDSSDNVTVSVLMAIFASIIWYYISWQPLIGCTGFLESATFQCLDSGATIAWVLDMAHRGIKAVSALLKAVLPFSKIIISYFQVVSTFITTFSIPWPDEIFAFLQNMDVFNLDFLSLPATTCLVSDLDYSHRVALVTLAPLVVLALLAIPSCIARLMASSGSRSARERFEETVSAFFWWGLFLLFVVYPAVSVSVLSTFSCLDLGRTGNLLRSDMRVQCPERGEFVWVFSLVAIFVYPVGIPVGMFALLYYYDVPKMARQKKTAAGLKALIATFRQEVAAGQEEGLTGRELEQWWEGPGGWTRDPAEALGDAVQLKALLRHEWHDPTANENDTTITTLLVNRGAEDKERARERLRSMGRTKSSRPNLKKSASIQYSSSFRGLRAGNSVSARSSPQEVVEQGFGDGLDHASLASLRRQVARLA